MDVQVNGARIMLEPSYEELLLLTNCVNEAIEAVEEWEFTTRLGAEVQEARQLLSELGNAIAGVGPLQ